MNNVTLIGMPGSGKSTIGSSDTETGEKKAFRDHRAGRTGKI